VARPLLSFLAIGLVLFALDRWVGPGSAPDTSPLVVPAERVEAVRSALAGRLGRPPEAAELRRALAPEVDDALLFREALARGYVRDDPVVFRRLVRNLRFAGAEPQREDEALFEEALELGLQHTDVVVRRRLVQRMRLDLEARALRDPPDEAALRAWLEAHPERYRAPARARLAHLYFAREEAARRALGRLRAEGAGPPAATGGPSGLEAWRALGEPFLHPPEQPSQSRAELARRFGAGLADAAFDAPLGRWTGPVASAYGSHLLWVYEREPARALRLAEVRGAVRAAVLAERRREALEAGLARLRAAAEVRIAGLGGS